ncbi:MAG: hypothetical protein J6B23_07605, partial [Clostridia bacterium]|nr:hypothetical protein [Clostridia bacterium]
VYYDENGNSVSGRDVFFQFTTNAPADMKSYVYEIDVYPIKLPETQGYKCSLFNAIDTDGSMTPITIVGSSLVYNDEKLMTVECNKWTKFSVIVDTENLTFDLYADRILVKENLAISKNIRPATIRVAINAGYMYTEMYFDDIKLYEGNSFRDIPLYVSTAENKDDVASILGDSTVFMTEKDSVYTNGSKTTYTSLGYGKLYEDGVLYVTADAASAALGCTAEDLSSYVEDKNGTSYIPLTESLAASFGKSFYEDERGWICISSSDLNLSNYIVSTVSTEDSDIIDRFMHFDRPSGDAIYNAIKAKSYQNHPRIWVTDADVAKLKSDIVSNSFKKEAAKATIYMADLILTKEPVAYEKPDNVRLFQSCLEVRNRIMTLSAAYLISDEIVRDKYAAKIWEEVENACNWKDWNLTSHYLDSGKIGPGIALAYDVCYDYFTNEQKAFIRNSLKEKYLYYAAASYAGNTAHYSIGKNNNNWGTVCNGSVLLVCLATMDEEDENSEYSVLTRYLASEALQGMEYSIGSLFPSGAWSEGLGYFEYMAEYIAWTANALRNSCGSDYGLISYPGVGDMPLYALYIQTINNGYFNFSDGAGIDETSSVCPEIFLLASMLGRQDITNMWYDFKYNKLKTSLYSNRTVRDMLFYTPDTSSSEMVYDFPLDAKFGSVEIGVMKSGWDEDDIYVASVGGAITSHWDKGGFVFDALGERWAIDLGKDDYNIEGGYYGTDGATIYRKRAEGHNVIVINPDEDAGQIFGASATLKSTCYGNLEAYHIYDLSKVYGDDVTKAERGFYLGDSRQTLTVQDEFS